MRFLVLCLLVIISNSVYSQTTDFGCKHLKNQIRFATKKSMNNADSVHIAHYNINVDSVSFNNQQLWSRTELTAVSLVDGLNIVRLDLQGHIVDSVILEGNSATTFIHDGLNLDINIPSINTNDTSRLMVHYHGQPSQDPSGWGGFYWSGTSYAFNLGVGFDEDPHVYGRSWYPCLDVFTDKSTYDFRVTVDSAYLPVCNGEMMSRIGLGDERKTTHWHMNDPIPTYLTAMAIAPFILIEREYSGIPSQVACLPSDTNNVNSTFTNMQACVDRFFRSFRTVQVQ
jgi:aminopeptidase N